MSCDVNHIQASSAPESIRVRFRGQKLVAMLAGVTPIPENSGQVTTRYRLNRYGDRNLQAALHTVVQSPIRYQKATRDHAARRTAEGKTGREVKRCLDRYVARDLYRLLESGLVSNGWSEVGRSVDPVVLGPA